MKKAQVPMELADYRRLERVAREQGLSVDELIRLAIEERYPASAERRREAVKDILAMVIPSDDWVRWEDEVSRAHEPCPVPK